MKLLSEIGPGNRVKVLATNKYGQDVSYYATVVEWTPSGKLKIISDLMMGTPGPQTKCVSAIQVKKIR